MKNVMMAIVVSVVVALGAGRVPGSRVMFWNLENYFDWRNDSTGVSDAEFSSRGARRWTRRRFRAKSNAIAKGILWAGAPEIIGLAEVENRFVLRQLINTTALQKLDYEIVHYDSPDSRGIDVAMLYRRNSLSLLDSKACHIYEDTSILATRDILLATFEYGSGDRIAVLVNHHPSKYGGAEESETRRWIAVSTLKNIVDSLQQAGVPRIVAIGDFNDTPDNAIYGMLPMENLSLPLHLRGLGTIRFEGEWELIDQCFVSGMSEATLEILYIPFLMVPDREHGGQKPLRTYSGPRYLGGVSDHCPILLQYSESKEK
ncbi:MAG: hypothetical protein J6W09_04820 [Bacteroidales bacterium]|nr:hypothetical protein [Bacteroidales bacterium]